MNCKPGDLAIVVRHVTGVPSRRNAGAIVKCVAMEGVYEFGPVWRIDPALPNPEPDCDERLIYDACLRPIRPQDDDAKDESTLWLPAVPTKEHA